MKAPVDGGQGLEIFLEFEARKIPPEIKRGKVFLNNFLMIPIHSVYIFIEIPHSTNTTEFINEKIIILFKKLVLFKYNILSKQENFEK